jgi:hypothetical protein
MQPEKRSSLRRMSEQQKMLLIQNWRKQKKDAKAILKGPDGIARTPSTKSSASRANSLTSVGSEERALNSNLDEKFNEFLVSCPSVVG